jgi:thiamine-monophosphate kinase
MACWRRSPPPCGRKKSRNPDEAPRDSHARLNEFEIIHRFFSRPARHAVQGVGDDCARVRVAEGMELAITTDLLVEGRHFLPGADARKLGHKALSVNLSDLAAAGAEPRWATLALSLPSADEAWLGRFSEGFFALADGHGVDLVGGDTTRGPLAIDITAFGEVPAGEALSRAGAQPRDDIWVSGELGGAALALVHPELEGPARRLHEPQPRVALGRHLRGLARAAIDVSDGLAGDLGHILERSGKGAVLDYDRIPRDAAFKKIADARLEAQCVLSGGDDYELLFTAPQSRRVELEALARELALPLSRIGEITSGTGLTVLDRGKKPMPYKRGFDHFAAA